MRAGAQVGSVDEHFTHAPPQDLTAAGAGSVARRTAPQSRDEGPDTASSTKKVHARCRMNRQEEGGIRATGTSVVPGQVAGCQRELLRCM